MKYCVLVKISKQQLGFWYQMEGGVVTPLSITGANIVPLCFYVNGNDFKIGEFANERFLVNDRNAYNDYFDIVKDPANHFVLHGDSKPVKQLLYYGVENYLSHFIKTILYKNESIEGFRTSFCLRLWFEDDIENQERILVENLFKEAGYENVEEINVDFILNKEITNEIKSSKLRLCLSAISNDLYVKLFSLTNFNLIGSIKLDQLGSDPRAKIIAKLILEDIKEANPHIYIDEEKEISFIINHCIQLLSSLSPIMRNEILLSTGVKTDYKIRLSHLEERLIYNRGIEDKVIPQLESIITANGMEISSVDIILKGDELNTNYFKDKLTKKFPNVYGISSLIEVKLIKLMFSQISSSDYKIISKLVNSDIVDLSKTTTKKLNTNEAKVIIKPQAPMISGVPPVPILPGSNRASVLKSSPVASPVPKPIKVPPPVSAPKMPTIPSKSISTNSKDNSKLQEKSIKPNATIKNEVKPLSVPLPPVSKVKLPPPPPPPPPLIPKKK
jgi:hypothetical protein